MFGFTLLVVIALLHVPEAQSGLTFLVVVSLLPDFFLFMLQPLYQVVVAEYTPADSRGLSYGYTYLAQFGFGALGAAIVGFVLIYSVIETVFLVRADSRSSRRRSARTSSGGSEILSPAP